MWWWVVKLHMLAMNWNKKKKINMEKIHGPLDLDKKNIVCWVFGTPGRPIYRLSKWTIFVMSFYYIRIKIGIMVNTKMIYT
jgi:hypothetical protein